MSVPPVPSRGPDDLDPTGIRALLSAMPDPGPMPPDLVQRIQASIAAEQSARAGGGRADGAVVPLRVHGPRRWQRFAWVAAAAVVAAVAVPALLGGSPSAWLASLTAGGGAASSASSIHEVRSAAGGAPNGPIAGLTPQPGTRVTTYASGAAYTASGFAQQAAVFASGQGTPLASSTSPNLGPCLAALHLDPLTQVRADLATFDGQPAVVIVATSSSSPATRQAYAVDRTCTAGTLRVLAGPVGLP